MQSAIYMRILQLAPGEDAVVAQKELPPNVNASRDVAPTPV